MPVFQLILSSDTIEVGREKINAAFSATTGLWSGSTGFQSLIHNNGTGNIASGDYAIAAGSGNTAIGDFSFAGGDNCIAFGNYSYAFGFMNSASGNSAHAEGGGTEATGDRSHAEGNATKALGNSSHAEGSNTIALGNYSHAEGYFTEANGDYSHAEGHTTIASGNYSHAQGSLTTASGNYSFAGGRGNGVSSNIISNGNTSFAFYRQTTATPRGANGDFSAILGGQNHFIGSFSTSSIILGGENNIIDSSLPGIIIGGNNTQIINDSVGGAFYSEGATLTNNSYGTLFLTNGRIDNSSVSSIENSFGPVGSVCEIIDSSYSKISGRDFSFGFNRISNFSDNSSIYNSHNCRINNGQKVFIVSSINVQNSPGGADNNSLIMGNGPGIPSAANKTIRLQAASAGLGVGVFETSVGMGTADYAEFFEWKDENINNEKRYGYFVSLDGDKIEIGNYNLIGIVSANPAIITDSAPFKWKDSFVTDEWGNKEYVTYKKYKIQLNSGNNSNNEEEIIVSARTINTEEENFTGETSSNNTIENYIEIYFDEKNNVYSVLPGLGDILGVLYTGDTTEKIYIEDVSYPKINPLYDPSQTYIPREERPEWSPIGLLGKLHVRTAETITGSTVSSNSDGMAVNGPDYHVLKQVMDFNEDKGYGVVQILFK